MFAADAAPVIDAEHAGRTEDGDPVRVGQGREPGAVFLGNVAQGAIDRSIAEVRLPGILGQPAPVRDVAGVADALRAAHQHLKTGVEDLVSGSVVVPQLRMGPRRFAGARLEVDVVRINLGRLDLFGLIMQIDFVQVLERDRRINRDAAIGTGGGAHQIRRGLVQNLRKGVRGGGGIRPPGVRDFIENWVPGSRIVRFF